MKSYNELTDKEKESILFNFKGNGLIPPRGNFTDEELMDLLKIDESAVKKLYNASSAEENLVYLIRKTNLKQQAEEQEKEGTHALHCPNCNADLPIHMHTMGSGGRFHCPLCEKYFDKEGKIYDEDEPWTPDV